MSNRALLDAVISRSTGKDSRIHGPAHWAGVAAAGLILLDSTPDADPLVVLLFALFHDSMRRSDGHDPEHGKRGAKLARTMRDAGDFELEEARLLKLEEACISHDKGGTSMDPTIGVCWDADRLNLWRVGTKPKPALLSTPAARRLTEQAARYCSFGAFDWRALFLNYDFLIRGEAPVYLRFGGLPEGGCSAAGLGFRECGVSVYPGIALEDGSYVLDFRRTVLGIDTRYLRALLLNARPLYLVQGRRVGTGGTGEPVLSDVRIVEEVSPRSVDVLPDRPRFKALIEAWRAKREGRDPGIWPFMGPLEPDERPLWPIVSTAPKNRGGFFEAIEAGKREKLKEWGMLEDYDRMQAEQKTRQARSAPHGIPGRSSLESFNQAPWKETPWM